MTLVEMLVAVAVGSLVLTAVGLLMFFTARSFVALGNYNDLDQASRTALDTISRDIREARSLVAPYTTNRLVFIDNNTNTLVLFWDPTTRILTKTVGTGTPKVLLEQCDYLRFGISQRNPSNAFNFYPAASTATAKLVDVTWTCSRQMFQKKVNTESMQTAKIVIRN